MYNVQDVIDAVQNGESDFEMDDTDGSDEDAGCVDKENQQPTDCSVSYVDIEPTRPSPPNKLTMPRGGYRWCKRDYIRANTDFSGPDSTDDAVSLHTPLEYFQKFVSVDMIQALAKNTNEYSFQKNGTSIDTNQKEIEQVIGMYLKMGLMQMSGVRMYWETDTRYAPVSDVMPRNRFQSLLTSLHFVDNRTVSETEKRDKLWKLGPWLKSLREKCAQVVPEEHTSVFEMMSPFDGKFCCISQYMQSKPHPWGFKLWVRTGISGMICDFDVCQDGVNGDNKYMGGADLLEYMFPMTSRRWYICVFWHTIILAVVNAWLLYQRDCKALNIPTKEILSRRLFQAQLASSLILVNTTVDTPKRGRPSSGNGRPVTETVPLMSSLTAQKRPFPGDGSPPSGVPAKRTSAHPPVDIRKDMIAHFPVKTKRGRCRHCAKGYTNTLCSKCNVRLCFSEEKNCLWDYHCK